jgi:hypothetical protein
MHPALMAAFGVASLGLAVVIAREGALRFLVRYEYRFDSFSVLGPFGRQRFQIRQNEIVSLTPVRADAPHGGAKRWSRTQFKPQVVIRARMVAEPVVVSWEGEPIAGLTPEGLKLRSHGPGKRR